MPILVNNRPLLRIKLGDNVNIREVRAGTDLVWGLYEITYNNGINLGDTSSNITEYVWGYPGNIPEDFTLVLPEGMDYTGTGGFLAVEVGSVLGTNNAYRSKALGWYNNPQCIDNPSDTSLSYIPAITRDFHQDLLLFCKWKQRQYRYKGSLYCKRYVYVG